jgi:hypothetical protein
VLGLQDPQRALYVRGRVVTSSGAQLARTARDWKPGGRSLRPYRAGASEEIVSAIQSLRAVRGKLGGVGAKRAAAAVARALKSVEGALRHARRIQDVAGRAS